MSLQHFWRNNAIGWAIGTALAVTLSMLLPASPLLAMVLGGGGSIGGMVIAAYIQFWRWDREFKRRVEQLDTHLDVIAQRYRTRDKP